MCVFVFVMRTCMWFVAHILERIVSYLHLTIHANSD